jgi:hypothetical protein
LNTSTGGLRDLLVLTTKYEGKDRHLSKTNKEETCQWQGDRYGTISDQPEESSIFEVIRPS